MKRRSFFKRLAQAAAIIGLAPRLAFRVPDEPIRINMQQAAPFWIQTGCVARFYSDEFLEMMAKVEAKAFPHSLSIQDYVLHSRQA